MGLIYPEAYIQGRRACIMWPAVHPYRCKQETHSRHSRIPPAGHVCCAFVNLLELLGQEGAEE